MKRILYPFVGDSVGGSHISTIITIKNLDKKRFIYDVVLEENGVLAKVLKKNNIDYHLLNTKENCNFIFSFFKRFIFLRQVKPDIVHTNDIRMHHKWTFVCFINNTSHVWHQHTFFNSRKNRFYSFFAKKIITISKFCSQSFSKKINKKIEIITNPFESNNFKSFNNSSKNFLKKKLGFKLKDKIIIFIGEDNYQKRFDFFISLANDLSKKNKHLKFIIFLKKLKKKQKFKKNFKFFFEHYDTTNYLKISDILVSPAVNEGFGRVLVEASLTKTLVIASESGGHKEIIKENFNGFLVEKDSYEKFINKIIYSLKNLEKNEIQNIIKTAFIFSKKKYNLISYKNKIFSIYETL